MVLITICWVIDCVLPNAIGTRILIETKYDKSSRISCRCGGRIDLLKVFGPITYGFIHRSGVFDIR